jgi:hypothetical protein
MTRARTKAIEFLRNWRAQYEPRKPYRLTTSFRACMRQIRHLDWRANGPLDCELCDRVDVPCDEWFEGLEMAVCETCAREHHAAAWRDLCPIPGVMPTFEVLPDGWPHDLPRALP